MARTTSAAVTAAIETSLTTEQVTAFIDDASVWVDQYLTDKGLSDALLATIEKYLACHFITLRDPRLRSGTVGDVSETYQRDTQVSEYLKAAAAMDPTGTVASRLMDGKPAVRFRAGAGFDSTLSLPAP